MFLQGCIINSITLLLLTNVSISRSRFKQKRNRDPAFTAEKMYHLENKQPYPYLTDITNGYLGCGQQANQVYPNGGERAFAGTRGFSMEDGQYGNSQRLYPQQHLQQSQLKHSQPQHSQLQQPYSQHSPPQQQYGQHYHPGPYPQKPLSPNVMARQDGSSPWTTPYSDDVHGTITSRPPNPPWPPIHPHVQGPYPGADGQAFDPRPAWRDVSTEHQKYITSGRHLVHNTYPGAPIAVKDQWNVQQNMQGATHKPNGRPNTQDKNTSNETGNFAQQPQFSDLRVEQQVPSQPKPKFRYQQKLDSRNQMNIANEASHPCYFQQKQNGYQGQQQGPDQSLQDIGAIQSNQAYPTQE